MAPYRLTLRAASITGSITNILLKAMVGVISGGREREEEERGERGRKC